MKLDLFTAIGVAIAGLAIAFFVTNLLMPELEPFTYTAIDKGANSSAAENGYNYADLSQPDNEVFNYEALNPTVEVYVGECDDYDANGNCIEAQAESGEGEEDASDTEDTTSGTDEQENE